MKDLENFIIKVPTHSDGFGKWFQEIAKLLLNNYHIETRVATYRFTEIEFYYYSESHKDESTYGYSSGLTKDLRIKRHKEAQTKPLTWFFHYSGIDISIGNGINPGGILIRGIEKMSNPKEIFDGPLKVQLELLNQNIYVGGGTNLKLKLIRNVEQSDTVVKAGIRKGIGANAGVFQDLDYRFYTE